MSITRGVFALSVDWLNFPFLTVPGFDFVLPVQKYFNFNFFFAFLLIIVLRYEDEFLMMTILILMIDVTKNNND